jgi:phage baseplate assembly protein gpV
VNGNLTMTGGDVTADGISLKTHVHGGVTTGSGDTTGPL